MVEIKNYSIHQSWRVLLIIFIVNVVVSSFHLSINLKPWHIGRRVLRNAAYVQTSRSDTTWQTPSSRIVSKQRNRDKGKSNVEKPMNEMSNDEIKEALGSQDVEIVDIFNHNCIDKNIEEMLHNDEEFQRMMKDIDRRIHQDQDQDSNYLNDKINSNKSSKVLRNSQSNERSTNVTCRNDSREVTRQNRLPKINDPKHTIIDSPPLVSSKKKNCKERLQKILARAGVSSRRGAEMMILDGEVSVNGQLVTELGTKVDPRQDKILVKGKTVSLPDSQSSLWIVLNKPKDVIGTIKPDPNGRTTLFKFLPKAEAKRLVTVGSMDRDDTGLIILTNEVGWIHQMTHPSYSIHRKFDLVLRGIFSVEDCNKMLEQSSRFRSLPPFDIVITDYNKKANQTMITLEIRKSPLAIIDAIVEELQSELISCKRTEFGSIKLRALKKGDWRLLSPGEVDRLKASCSKD